MKSLRETCAAWLERSRPADPESAVWAELSPAQQLFILRGLGLDPDRLTMHNMTRRERAKLMTCIEAWAGTAEKLRAILGTCRAEQQRDHLTLVADIDRQTLPQAPAPARKERAA
ncbi:hypothetical protein [Alcanivorax sp.]|jgi:hypothetical protein|uniref:hypothetical protein n=1 Tax=Alcanivorax sp. TaxID=1872427 RepID=UPI0025B7F2C6|nr:hypothetical protein [Alcanivorax sp.]